MKTTEVDLLAVENRMKELIKSRKENLEELKNKTDRLDKILKIKEDLQQQQNDLRDTDDKMKEAYDQFAAGEITAEMLKTAEEEHLKAKNFTSSVMCQIEALEEQINKLRQDIKKLQAGIRSIEKYIWQIIFTKLKTEFIEKLRPELEKLFVILNNANGLAPGPGAIDIIFNDMYGRFSFGPAKEKVEALTKELEHDYFEDKRCKNLFQ